MEKTTENENPQENLGKVPKSTTNTPQMHQEEEFHAIVADFERRLQEQVLLAKEDVVRDFEQMIQVTYF